MILQMHLTASIDETKILAEEDQAKKESYLALLMLVKNILEACIDMLGFEAPERM